MEFRDYYAILGVPPSATLEQIERAYKRLVTFSHPDVYSGDAHAEAWANERMKQIHEAYDVLKDEAKRDQYDERHKAWRKGQRRAGSTHRDQAQGQRVRCPLCGGPGEVTCLTCLGRGDWSCPGCGGSKQVVCPVCGGAGSLTPAEYERLRKEVERAERQARERQHVEQEEIRRRAEAAKEAEARRQSEQEAVRAAQAERARKFAGAVLGVFILLLFGRSCLSSISAPGLATAPPVNEKPTPPAGPSPIAAQVEAVLISWIDTLRNEDLDAHMGHYAPNLEWYFLKRNVPWRSVYADKKSFLEKYPKLVDYRISNLQTDSVAWGVAVAVFDKAWDFRTADGQRFAGEERQRLKLLLSNQRWRIISEEELTVYWVVLPKARSRSSGSAPPRPTPRRTVRAAPAPTIPPPPPIEPPPTIPGPPE